MFNDEQLKVLKECLDNKYGENLIQIRDLGNSSLCEIQKTVEEAIDENEIINQIKSVLRANFGS